jgi:hypothetical protein
LKTRARKWPKNTSSAAIALTRSSQIYLYCDDWLIQFGALKGLVNELVNLANLILMEFFSCKGAFLPTQVYEFIQMKNGIF